MFKKKKNYLYLSLIDKNMRTYRDKIQFIARKTITTFFV